MAVLGQALFDEFAGERRRIGTSTEVFVPHKVIPLDALDLAQGASVKSVRFISLLARAVVQVHVSEP